VPAYRTGTQK